MTDKKRKTDPAEEIMRSLLEQLSEYEDSPQSWLLSLERQEDQESASDRAISEFRREFGRRIRERARSAS